MLLNEGTRLASYEITGRIGAGGMGEVYRAHDARLGRDVAIKVLPSTVASDPSALARFEREARAVAALNHPNIVNVFDTGRHNDVSFVVMELLEGETLRARLEGAAQSVATTREKGTSGTSRTLTGGLPRKKALEIACQVAQGLAAAHTRGIVHRDLKPDNIFLTNDGRVKILDFGLARALPDAMQTAGDTRTQLSPIAVDSVPGLVLGTVGYMAPEQVRGQAVDHRADIFAFGAVLFEILTGTRAFDGGSPIETMGAILKSDPLESPGADVAITGPLEPLVRHCLEKGPDERFQSARDLAFQLQAIASGALSTSSAERAVSSKSGIRRLMPALLVLAALAAGVMIGRSLQTSPDERLLTASIPMPTGVHMDPGISPSRSGGVAVSPDGQRIAFVGQGPAGETQIFVRELDSPVVRALAGTEEGSQPAWSPDGRELAFRHGPSLKRVGLDGGSPQTIVNVGNVRSPASWSSAGMLLLHQQYRGPLVRVPVAGGEVTTVLPANPLNWFSPVWLPDGRRFLVARFAYFDGQAKEAGIYVGSVDSQETRLLVPGRIAEIALGDRELFFRRGSELVAQPFDANTATLTGDARVLSNHVSMVGAGGSTVVFHDPPRGLSEGHQITWFSRRGEVLSRVGSPSTYRDPRLSPDGRYLAIARADDNGLFSLWTFDLVRNIDTRVSRSTAVAPAWSHDGRALYAGWTDGLARFDPVSGGEPVIVHAIEEYGNVATVTPDGKDLLFYVLGSGIIQLRALALDGSAAPRAVAPPLRVGQTSDVSISPDGRWLVGHVADGGRRLYAFPYTGSGPRIPVAGIDGRYARWRGDGRELYFATRDSPTRILAVPVTWSSGQPEFGTPQPLFTIEKPVFVNRAFDVTPDGQRFIAVVNDDPDRSPLTLQVRVR